MDSLPAQYLLRTRCTSYAVCRTPHSNQGSDPTSTGLLYPVLGQLVTQVPQYAGTSRFHLTLKGPVLALDTHALQACTDAPVPRHIPTTVLCSPRTGLARHMLPGALWPMTSTQPDGHDYAILSGTTTNDHQGSTDWRLGVRLPSLSTSP